KKRLITKGVPSDKIILEENSTNTLEQAEQIIKMAQTQSWKRFFLVASHYHQPRAFLTFLKILKRSSKPIEIINAPCKDLDWFSENHWGSRINLLETEFKKITIYQKKGHVASYSEAIEYQKWKEK
ncbi:MAG: YdcF family protein, partial [Candidatus Magasanikbacteria bacterium]|nr:YdcF family protein [Candidatus Magasanikbacteria bacterium]